MKIGAALLLAACHAGQADQSPQPATVGADKVWFLETSGARPADTTVAFAARTGRTVVMRHPSPDDALFAVLRFPPATDTARARDTVLVTIRPTPGQYGFVISTTDKFPAGAVATFSYAVHFRTPADAAASNRSPGRFEMLVVPALVSADHHVQLLSGTRPAADMLQFPLLMAGTYALVAPR